MIPIEDQRSLKMLTKYIWGYITLRSKSSISEIVALGNHQLWILDYE
jgi:hypothetical protein